MPYVGRDLQRGNYLKLDDISSSFNGSTTTFNLTSGNSAFYPGSSYSILVSVGGVIQEPESAYTINKSQITFANAPHNVDKFFCIALGLGLGIGVPGHGTVGGDQLQKPLNYDGGLLYLDDTNNRVGVNSESPTVALDVIGDIKLNGNLVTAGTGGGGFNAGVVTCTGLDVNGNADFSGNVSIGGTLTYLDVTNIDSVGIITAQQGIHLGAASTVGHLSTVGVSSISSLQVRDLTATHIAYAGANGRLTGSSNLTFSGGTVTATSFTGTLNTAAQPNITSVGTLTALTVSGNVNISDNIVHSGNDNLKIRFPAPDTFAVETAGAERFRIGATGISTFTNHVRIVKSSGPLLELTTNTGSGDAILRLSEGATGSTTNGGGMFYSAANNKLHITCGTDSTTKRITILRDDGKVGIGTETPLNDLHLNKNGNNGVSIRMENYEGYSTIHNDGAAFHFDSAQHIFRNAAGSSDFGRFDTSGRLLVGNNASIAHSSADDLQIGNGSNTRGLTIYSGNANNGSIYFADGSSGNEAYRGFIEYYHNTDTIGIGVSGDTRIKSDSKGQLAIKGGSEAFDTTSHWDNSLNFYHNTTNGMSIIGPYSSGGTTSLHFYTNSGGGAASQKLCITGEGHIVTQGLTDDSFDNDGGNTKIFEVSGDGTVGEYGVINISGNQNTNGADLAHLRFVNRENSHTSSGSNAGSRTVAAIQSYVETSDTNAGDDSGGYLKFLTKPESSGVSEVLRVTSGGTVNIGGDWTQTTYKLKVTGSFAATTKSFVIDHPTKENHSLRYACLEGPENSVYVRGRSSDPVIELPDYWVGLVHDDSITVNVTPIGNKKVWVESINNNSVTIGSDDSTEYFYTVFAERKDVEKLEVEVEK